MSRLIDADAFEVITYKGREGTFDDGVKWLAEQIDAQPTIEPERKWIPCSERLPEVDEDGYSDKVLVCFDKFPVCEICEYRTDKWYIGDLDDSPEDVGLKVIAWMPLPEPYEEVES